jgi:class III poly(R)-hydroxyalkanoic acid synthase PhaE subunit
MNERRDDPFGMNSAMTTWMKSMGQFWGQMVNQSADQWSAASENPATGSQSENRRAPKGQAAMAAALKNWQAMANALTTPESMESVLKGGGAMPDLLMKLAQTALGSFLGLQQEMIQRLGRLGESTEAYKFEDIDENIFRLWSELYEKEFRQFLRIPQLGLMRSYQEKAGAVADKYALFQANLSEFLRMLGLPFNRSIEVMQGKLGEMAESGSLPNDTKAYYNLWVKVLEGHFMTLYQTPEYVQTLGKTVNSLAEFAAARDAAVEDLLSMLPVAKKSEMDDLARELYELKRRLRKLEQTCNR